MSRKKLKVSLDEIGLEKEVKGSLTNLIQVTLKKATVELGRKKEVIVYIPGTEITIVKGKGKNIEDDTNKSKPKHKETKCPTVRERLMCTRLDENVKNYLVELNKKKGIKANHINDVIKTCLDTSAENLSPEDQIKLVNYIVENRNQINIRNCEYSSALLTKEGIGKERDIENWIGNILRSVSEIIEKLDIKENLEELSEEQKKELSQAMNTLKIIIEDIMERIN